MDIEFQLFHLPYESKNNLHDLLDYLMKLKKKMVIYLFDKLPIEEIIDIVMDYPFCKIKYDNKNRNIMFMYEMNIQMDMK